MKCAKLQHLGQYYLSKDKYIFTSSCSNLTNPVINKDLELLKISLIIGFHKLPTTVPTTIPYLYIPLREKDQWTQAMFMQLLTEIHKHITTGNILIHCKAGRTRSMLTAFAMAHTFNPNFKLIKDNSNVTRTVATRFNRYITFYNRIPINILSSLSTEKAKLDSKPYALPQCIPYVLPRSL